MPPPASFLSFSDTPSIQRSILISVLFSNHFSLLVTVQASALYTSTGLIIVLYTFPLRCLAFLHLTKHLLPRCLDTVLDIILQNPLSYTTSLVCYCFSTSLLLLF